MKSTPILAAFAVTLSALASTAMAVETFTYDAEGNLTHIKGIPVEPIQTPEEARIATKKRVAEIKAQEAKQAAQAATTSNLQSEIGNHQLFYTGKPYLEETGQYLFLFRHYDPELARWTTADPSGFPDGANIYFRAGSPTKTFDALGLWYDEHYRPSDALVDFAIASAAVNSFGISGFTISQRLGDFSLANDPEDHAGVGSFNNPYSRLAPSDEIAMLRTHSAFTGVFTDGYFAALTSGGSATTVAFTQLIEYPYNTDAGFSYGRVLFSVEGEFSYTALSGGGQRWTINPLFMFDDRYDFNVGSNNPAIAAFARLQYHDIAYNFINSGEWFGSYSGVLE